MAVRCPLCNSKVGPLTAAYLKGLLARMTTDPDEGRRQIEAMQPPKLAVGDKVRLKAGGERVFTIQELQDYENLAVCDWGDMSMGGRDTFPVGLLVKVGDGEQAGAGPRG